MSRSILDYFDVSLDFFTHVVLNNPSLRGMIHGYIAEAKLKEALIRHGRGSAFRKDDDHDRKKKGDLVVTYEGLEFKIEVKSLQTNTVEMLAPGGEWLRKIVKQKGPGQLNPSYLPVWEKHRFTAHFRGQFQCDASDRRKVEFPDGSSMETTNLLYGDFHILAAGIFTFREKWDFGFALNRDLPASTNTDYTEYQRQHLITSMIPITWPLQPPFVSDIYGLLDRLVAEEQATQEARLAGPKKGADRQRPVETAPITKEPRVKIAGRKQRKKS